MTLGNNGSSIFSYRQPTGIYFSYTMHAKDVTEVSLLTKKQLHDKIINDSPVPIIQFRIMQYCIIHFCTIYYYLIPESKSNAHETKAIFSIGKSIRQSFLQPYRRDRKASRKY